MWPANNFIDSGRREVFVRRVRQCHIAFGWDNFYDRKVDRIEVWKEEKVWFRGSCSWGVVWPVSLSSLSPSVMLIHSLKVWFISLFIVCFLPSMNFVRQRLWSIFSAFFLFSVILLEVLSFHFFENCLNFLRNAIKVSALSFFFIPPCCADV